MPTAAGMKPLAGTEQRQTAATKRALRTAASSWSTDDVNEALNRLLRGETTSTQFLEAAYRRIGMTTPPGLKNQLASMHGTGASQVFDYIGSAAEIETTRYAQSYAGNRITGIQRTSMQAIRSYVVESTQVPGSINGLRGNVSRVLLMDPKFMRTVVNQYRARDSKVKPATRAESQRAYMERIADGRASMIARTETISALNAGRSAGFRIAKGAGLLPPDTMQVWIAAPNDCPRCDQLDGAETTVGASWTVDGVAVEYPPLHPNCRCTIGIV